MRLFLFSLACACLACYSVNSNGQSAHKLYYDNALTSNVSDEPQFIDDLFMAPHYKKEVNKNIVDGRISMPGYGNEEKKFTVINNQVVLVSTGVPEAKDTTNIADKNAEPVNNNIEPDETAKNNTPTILPVTAPTKLPPVITDPIVTVEETTPGLEEEVLVEPVITKYAEMISVEPSDITNYPLYHFIDQWYGTRYKYGGTDNRGIDCSAFSQKLYGKVFNVELVRTAREQHRIADKIKDYDEATEGDLVFFRIHRLRISHVGVYLANGYFVHASKSKGVVISNLSNKYWSRRYASCGHVEREDKTISESDYLQ
jgi:cell wall-associated NlpC family hydrolase